MRSLLGTASHCLRVRWENIPEKSEERRGKATLVKLMTEGQCGQKDGAGAESDRGRTYSGTGLMRPSLFHGDDWQGCGAVSTQLCGSASATVLRQPLCYHIWGLVITQRCSLPKS